MKNTTEGQENNLPEPRFVMCFRIVSRGKEKHTAVTRHLATYPDGHTFGMVKKHRESERIMHA